MTRTVVCFRLAILLPLWLVVVAAFAPVQAGSPEIYSADGAAIEGYDTVAYWRDGKPVKGLERFAAPWRGARWLFSSAENRDLFLADPERYQPQYGGYCAYAASRGYVAPVEPDAWTIHGDKLYLNYNRAVRRRWEADVDSNIARADAIWPGPLTE